MKKKISKEDLNLNIEFIGEGSIPNNVTNTFVCGATNNTCTTFDENCTSFQENFDTCDTTTVHQSETFCQTDSLDDKCIQTNGCQTKKCVTQLCADTNSRAQLCCAVTKNNNCNDTVDNCASYVGCDKSKDICLETEYQTCVPMISKNPNCVFPTLNGEIDIS